jgi:hypothetical protein
MLELEHLAGPTLTRDMVHLSVIKTLNRNINAVYLEILDETRYAFDKTFGSIEADKDGKQELQCGIHRSHRSRLCRQVGSNLGQ